MLICLLFIIHVPIMGNGLGERILSVLIIDNDLEEWGLNGFSTINWLAFSYLLRNIIKWLAKFCVNKFKFFTCWFYILAQMMSMLLFSGACFWSFFFGSNVSAVLISSCKFSVDMLCLSKGSITMLKTCASLDIRRIERLFPLCFGF